MANSGLDSRNKFEELLKKAEEFHGHMGPFLVLGVRMSLAAFRELGTEDKVGRLKITIRTRPHTPFSCVIDGIQVTTHCTVGNRKLKLRNSQDISATFKAQNGAQVTVSLNSQALNQLTKSLASNHMHEGVEKLATIIASMPEEDLLILERQ